MMDNLFVMFYNIVSKNTHNPQRELEWAAWLGQPMVYDSGLCVNRTKEEIEERNKYPNARLMI